MDRDESPMRPPACIGIIMDGNRRWAHTRGLSSAEGHRAGYEKLKEVARWAKESGIGTTIVYAFSTENWSRSADEVGALMDLLRSALSAKLDEIRKEDVRVAFIGDRSRFSPDIRDLMRRTEEETASASSGTLVIALSYGGRAEIVEAARALCVAGMAPDDITEDVFSGKLWTASIPDPDLVIRTGGEFRLSNFLPWQSVYSELFFTNTHWPDFSREEFSRILAEYARRERRHGA